MTDNATALLFERSTNELLDAITDMLEADGKNVPLLEHAINQIVDLASTFNLIIANQSA
jgi:ABC-type uncharacterized transport system ATPase subunit